MRLALALVAALALTGTAATSAQTDTAALKDTPPRHCTITGFRPFAAAVWRHGAWQRGRPPQRVLRARNAAYACAPAAHRRAMQRTWRREASSFWAYRDERLRKPFIYPDGSWWAVPYPIAWCESGGNYYVGPSGAYGLIPPFPQYMAPAEQDRVALQLYREMGEGPWAPYEYGCAYR